MKELRIVFMGTPEFAVPSLEILVAHKFNIVAVITAPDKPKGRGQKVSQSPVKEYAVTKGLTVLQPANLKSPTFIEELKTYQANLQVVVAFRMLPEVVWNMPKYGTFNLHASLLPQYRGAAPINWAIINGEKETGVTTFFLKHEIDTGSIIFQEKEIINENDTAGSLYNRLMKKGAALVLKTVEAIQSGTNPTTQQPEGIALKHAPKLFKENCKINWNQSSNTIRNFIRGLCPYPAAWTELNGKTFKLYSVEVIERSTAQSLDPGGHETDNNSYLYIKTLDGWISVLEFQPEGKRMMNLQEFFRGNKL